MTAKLQIVTASYATNTELTIRQKESASPNLGVPVQPSAPGLLGFGCDPTF